MTSTVQGSIIPLLTIHRAEHTVRIAKSCKTIHSNGESYTAYPFGFASGGDDHPLISSRVELLIEHTSLWLLFPGEGQISATLQLIRESHPDDILRRFDGRIEIEHGKIYFVITVMSLEVPA